MVRNFYLKGMRNGFVYSIQLAAASMGSHTITVYRASTHFHLLTWARFYNQLELDALLANIAYEPSQRGPKA